MHKRAVPGLLAAIFLGACVAASPPLSPRYSWQEDGRMRHAQLVPDLLAEFGAGGPDLRQRYAGASVVTEHGEVTLWRLPDGDLEEVLAQLRGKGRYSPVFREGERGALRALPGGVLLRLHEDLSEREARDWLGRQQLEPVQPLPGNGYLLESPAGLAAIELADRLRQEPQVESASPNWWVQRQGRRSR